MFNPRNKRKDLVVLDETIADMISNKKLHYLLRIGKDVRLNTTNFFIIKI